MNINNEQSKLATLAMGDTLLIQLIDYLIIFLDNLKGTRQCPSEAKTLGGPARLAMGPVL
jgi:hypothetical protein